jgi:hypothetical protein
MIKRKRSTTKKATTPRTRTRRAVITKPKRRARRKSGGLNELFSPTMATGGAKVLGAGAIGGIGAGLLSKLIPTTTSAEMKAVYTLGAGFITATMLKMPSIGAGMSAVAVYNLLQAKNMLGENGDFDELGEENYTYADNLESLPMVLNEDQAMFLSGNEDYLQEDEASEYLEEENDYAVGYYGTPFGGI